MGTKCLIAIKKRRRQSKRLNIKSSDSSLETNPPALTSELLKKQNDTLADEYVRENFVVWQYVHRHGHFAGQGVGIWEFLRKFTSEWTSRKRADYVKQLHLIEEASEEFLDKVLEWYEKSRKDSRIFQSDQMNIPGFTEYMPCTVFCGSLIFDLIDEKKGHLFTPLAEPSLPLDQELCQFGYIVDFDENELHVLMFSPGCKRFASCPLLVPIEKIYNSRGLVLVKTFKFGELPQSEEEFLEILDRSNVHERK